MNRRGRLRDHGLSVGRLPPGPLNAITDVPDVHVGHLTLREGAAVRTGVTAILPHGDNVFRDRVPAGLAVGNGYGKLAGGTQVQELGELETPVVLTNTLGVAAGLDGLIGWTLDQPGNEAVHSVNAVVGETNDGVLNDIRARVVRPEHVRAALAAARSGPVAEGAVGAGTGTVCFGWKGGIGTASRGVVTGAGAFTLGALVQSNFSGDLTVCGVPVWADLQPPPAAPDGSVMIVLATDAPLSDRNLTRLARRAFLGVGRTGGVMANGSGDYALAFSTAPGMRRVAGTPLLHTSELPNAALTPLFQAAVEATEEAILNSLFAAHTITGAGGRTVQALPLDRVLALTRPA
jgi:D-aminopeptidase